MSTPYLLTSSLYYLAVPSYAWESEAAAGTGCGTAADPAAAANSATASYPAAASDPATAANPAGCAGEAEPGGLLDSALPVLRLVFKGYTWVAVPVWGQRENLAWNQAAQEERSHDESRSAEKARQANRQRPEADATARGDEPGVP